MAHFVSNRDESVRLFENPILEYFSHIHPATPLVVYIPTATVAMYYCLTQHTVISSVLMLITGIVLWTMFEYGLHRWAFHYEPKTKMGKKAHFLVHGIHHDYPRDSTRLVMPLTVSIPLAIGFYTLFTLLFGSLGLASFAGFALGYVAYDSIHYATHHFPMKSGVAKFLKQYHLRHHYTDEHTAYGVSNPLWDYVLGTAPKHVRDLEMKVPDLENAK